MSITEQLIKSGLELGFNDCQHILTANIIFGESLRKNCEMNSCGNYGRNWACPPHCGDITECISKAKQYTQAIVVQYVGALEDSYDFEGMMDAAQKFEIIFNQFAENAKSLLSDTYPLGAGGCHQCERCAILDDEPCRNPGIAYPSLEAHGIFVSDLAAKSNMKYINGQNTVTYFGALLFNS